MGQKDTFLKLICDCLLVDAVGVSIMDADLKRKNRPAQKLYVPPAVRNKKEPVEENNIAKEKSTNPDSPIEIYVDVEVPIVEHKSNERIDENKSYDNFTKEEVNNMENGTKMMENLVIKIGQVRTGPDKENKDLEDPPALNVNRKSKSNKSVKKKDILQMGAKKHSNKSIKKSPVKLVQVANWEDLFSEDDQEDSCNEQLKEESEESLDEQNEDEIINPKMQELEHVIELYDFPSSFRTQDLLQSFNEINKESIYIKWCDETHALLVLGSAIQANRALMVRNDFIKSRPMTMAGSIAKQVATKSDLKPAMKRPPTSMLAARRMITTALGTTIGVSREVQQKEREALKIAKELKKAQKQSENDAWEGHPRPSTA